MQSKKYYLSSFYKKIVDSSTPNLFFPQVTFYIPQTDEVKKIRIIID